MPTLKCLPMLHLNLSHEIQQFPCNGWKNIILQCKQGKLFQAMEMLAQGNLLNITGNSEAYSCLLRGCINARNISWGKIVHAHMIQSGYSMDLCVETKLLVMYSKLGFMENAVKVFGEMVEPSPTSWSALISGYAQLGHGRECFFWFRKMQRAGIQQDEFSFASVLKVCAGLGYLELGKQVHQCVVKMGLQKNIFVGSALVDVYVKSSKMYHAELIFDCISVKDVVSWTTLIAGYAQNDQGLESLSLFEKMLQLGITPNHYTFSSVLMACSCLAEVDVGRQIHARLVITGLLQNPILANCLLDMYCKCGQMDDAQLLFKELGCRNTVSWNALVAGYTIQGQGKKALQLYNQMQHSRIVPDEYTFGSILKSCSLLSDQSLGNQIHACIIKNRLEPHDVLGSSLIDMYAKCGNLEIARLIFDRISHHNLVCANTMIAAYSQRGNGEEALEIFLLMQQSGLKSDAYTFVSVLQACSSIADCDLGKQSHGQIIIAGLDSYVGVANSLIDMYAKAGSIEDAKQIFEQMPHRDVVSWTTMIASYGKHGHAKDAIELFERMQSCGVKADYVSFLAVLSACSHAGLVDKGWHYFNSMSENGLAPKPEHFGCMIDLISRTGHLGEAYDFILKMPIEPNAAMWGSFLGACLYYADAHFGKIAAERLFQLDPRNTANYVTLSNIFAACGMWEEVEKVRQLMKEIRVVNGEDAVALS